MFTSQLQEWATVSGLTGTADEHPQKPHNLVRETAASDGDFVVENEGAPGHP